VPLPNDAGAFGFDITLDRLSVLVGELRITPNSIIMVGKPQGSVFVQTSACSPLAAGCLPGGGEARLALTRAITDSAGHNRLHRHVGAGERAYELFVEPMPPTLGRQFVVAAAVPVVELSADSRALLDNSAVAAAIAVGLAVLAALAGSLLLSRPLHRITVMTERIRRLDFSDRAPVRSHISEVLRLSESVERMRDGLEVFGRYVSRGLVERIMHSPSTTGMRGVRRDITVMFTDIEGFSRIAEGLAPEVLTRRLSHYFEALGAAISANNGTIDKYIGDSIMAYWNAPEADEDHLAHACRAALQVAAASRHLASKWQGRGRPTFRTRIGVHTGPAVVGNVGTRERINYTLVGTVANQASRLEGLNKAYGTDVLVSGEVANAVAERFVWRFVDRVVAAGTTEAHDIYEPLGEVQDADRHADFLAPWREAQAAYAKGDFGPALTAFRQAAACRPEDGPCRVFVQRCEDFLHRGPPDGWTGAWHFERK
jgi:adenylate cyclase